MELIKIEKSSESPSESYKEIHIQTQKYYELIGFNEPWISYYLKDGPEIVGTCSFKGSPNSDNKVEIAYYTFEKFQGKGYGNKMCVLLKDIACSNGEIIVTARTLPQLNASTSILTKNGFHCIGLVNDPEDGEVWEWSL